jgi:hypothetical protein
MSFQKVAWACALSALLVIGARNARAAQMRFDVLRQSGWEPYLAFVPGPELGQDYSVEIFDQAGTLQHAWIGGTGFNYGTLRFASFEDLRSASLRLEYKPNASAETSVYRLTLDAPGWSTASLPAPRPSIGTDTIEAGQPLSVTWPVYAGGYGGAGLHVMTPSVPYQDLYDQGADYSAGSLLTGPLPAGDGYVEVDYARTLPGASIRMELQSGPDADLQPASEVQFVSWQGAGFSVTPEPSAPGALALALTLLRRRPRRA